MRISSDLHSQHRTGFNVYKISLYLFLSCVVIWFWFLEIGWSGNVSRGFVLITPASQRCIAASGMKTFSHFPRMHFVSRVILAVVSCLLAATFYSILKSPNCTHAWLGLCVGWHLPRDTLRLKDARVSSPLIFFFQIGFFISLFSFIL